MSRQSVNYGDLKPLRWDLDRDCTDVTEARIFIAKEDTSTPVINEVITFDGPKADGIVKWTPTADDFATAKLTPGEWLVKIRTIQASGPLTHPDDEDKPHGILVVLPMMAGV
jgi:hypothetical protein